MDFPDLLDFCFCVRLCHLNVFFAVMCKDVSGYNEAKRGLQTAAVCYALVICAVPLTATGPPSHCVPCSLSMHTDHAVIGLLVIGNYIMCRLSDRSLMASH